MTYFNDYTIMRPLVMDFTADANVNNIGDQFMFGSALMVAPVYEYGARSREVYFPVSCGWYDFYSGKYVNGGQKLTVDAPYERIPLYVCEGAIVLMVRICNTVMKNRLRKSLSMFIRVRTARLRSMRMKV